MVTRSFRVGDILKLERSKIAPSPTASYRQIGIYSWGKGVIENVALLGSELSKVTYYTFPSNALLLSNIQAWEAAIAVSDARLATDFIASQRFLPYTPIDEKVVDIRYLLHYFLSDVGMVQIRRASPGTVTRNRTLGQRAFENIVLHLPGLDEQKAVAARLDQAWKVAQICYDSEPVLAATRAALRDRVLRDLSGTERIKLGDVLSLDEESSSVEIGKSYPNLGILNRGRGLFEKDDISGAETSSSKLYPLKTNQLVYSKLFAWEGSVALVPKNFDGYYVSSEFPHFDVDQERMEIDYLCHVIRTAEFADQLRQAGTGMGQRRQRVRVERFLEIEVPAPCRPVQVEIARRLDMLSHIDDLQKQRLALASALPHAARNEVFTF